MVIYIHGFGGSGEGSKAKAFRKYFKSIGEDFIAPSLSYVPELAIKTLEELISSYHGEVYLIGSSLGGFYTTYLARKGAVRKAILINPSVFPTKTLQRAIGEAPNFFLKESAEHKDESYYNWNDKHLNMLKKYEGLDIDNYKGKFMVLLQKGDELLDYKEAELRYDGTKQIIEDGGNHGFEGIERHFETIEKFFAIGDHFKHTCKVKGVGFSNHELANRIGDLYYDDLALFLESLSKKLKTDANDDRDRGRSKLADDLDQSSKLLNQSSESIQKAWKKCEIPTIRWMIENGFNKNISLMSLDKLPRDILEYYCNEKITMPESLISEIKEYHDKEWARWNDPSGPSLIGTRADLYRFQENVSWAFIDEYPEYEDEIRAIVYNLIKA